MIDLAAFQRSVTQLVALAAGLDNSKCVSIKGGKLREVKGAYCTIALSNDRLYGKPSVSYTSSGNANMLNETVTTNTVFTLSINFFRDGAMQFANNIKGARYRSEVKALLRTAGIGWLNISAINNLTAAFSGESEERAQMNITLAAQGLSVSEINQALTVEVDIRDGDQPLIDTFYAYDAPNQGDFLAFSNEPEAA